MFLNVPYVLYLAQHTSMSASPFLITPNNHQISRIKFRGSS